MKFLILITVLLSGATLYSDGSKAAEAEKVIRQQRELEADALTLKATEDFKTAHYSDSSANLKRAIDLYMRASSSESRVLQKIRQAKS